MANEIIKNKTLFVANWNDYPSATAYHFRVSMKKDFSVIISEDSILTVSTKTVTLTGGNGKYFWQWRPFVGSWQSWHSVNSLILDTSLPSDISLPSTRWVFYNKTVPSDSYTLDEFPLYQIQDFHSYAIFSRNLKGDLITEWRTTKGRINLDFTGNFFQAKQYNEIMRFFNRHTSFYLACRLKDGDNFVYNIWEVMFTEDPTLTIVSAGRLDLWTGNLVLEEV